MWPPPTCPDRVLEQELRDHEEWLESRSNRGNCLRLREHLGVDFSGRRLSYASSERAGLMFSKFDQVRADHSDLHNADCSLASFYGADLRRATLTNTTLYGADFRKADLKGESAPDDAWAIGANFGGADLTGASFKGTILCHHSLRDQMQIYLATLGISNIVNSGNGRYTTIISQAQIDDATIDGDTVLPVALEVRRGKKVRRRSQVILGLD